MKWESATNEQLLTIFNEDIDCPTHLLSGAVTEAFNRKLFNDLIYWIFRNLTKNTTRAKDAWSAEDDDILSMGYCGIMNALNRWEPGKTGFKTFAYMNIRTEFTRTLEQEATQKREINKHSISYDLELENGESYLSLFPSRTNVEKEVIRKMEYEVKMEPLNKEEQTIIELFLEGYKFTEINRNLFGSKRTGKAIRDEFFTALGKIGLGHFVIQQSTPKKQSQRKLTEEIVREIRAAERSFKTRQEEADYYGISRKLIANIRKNKAWKEVV